MSGIKAVKEYVVITWKGQSAQLRGSRFLSKVLGSVKDTHSGSGGDGCDGADGNWLLSITQVAGAVGAGHDTWERSEMKPSGGSKLLISLCLWRIIPEGLLFHSWGPTTFCFMLCSGDSEQQLLNSSKRTSRGVRGERVGRLGRKKAALGFINSQTLDLGGKKVATCNFTRGCP